MLYDPQPAPKVGETYVVKAITSLYIVLEKVELSAKVELDEKAFRNYIDGG